MKSISMVKVIASCLLILLAFNKNLAQNPQYRSYLGTIVVAKWFCQKSSKNINLPDATEVSQQNGPGLCGRVARQYA